MTSSGRLSGKVAIVTGGASGIGFAIADLFSGSGATVHLLDLNSCPPELAARVTSRRVDVSVPADVNRAIDDILSGGSVDILVNSAGISHIGTVAQTTDEDFQRLFDVNVKGRFTASAPSLARWPPGEQASSSIWLPWPPRPASRTGSRIQ